MDDFIRDMNKANGYINQYDFVTAESILAKYIQQEPTFSHFWNSLGLVLRGQGRLNEARDAFIKAQAKEPLIPEAHYNLGRLEGEAVSFHRSFDIKRSKYGQSFLAHPDKIVYSCFEEQKIIQRLLQDISTDVVQFCVDIGAGDGLTFSNTYKLLEQNWKGLCVEVKSDAFAEMSYAYSKLPQRIELMNTFATPDNINNILKLANVPINFGLLSLDIDSYDYFVLEELLKQYTPSIICAEINDLIPPPVRWAMKYTHTPVTTKHFGQSISMLNDLLTKNNYSLVWLEYNNAFAVHNSFLSNLEIFHPITPEEAFQKGLTQRADWKLKLPWNIECKNVIYNAKPSDCLNIVKSYLHDGSDDNNYIIY
jgi:tetratricopeptide (TPR) repeat protein